MLIAAVDVIEAVDLGFAFGDEASEDEGGGGAEIGGHDGSAFHGGTATDAGGGTLKVDIGSHAFHFGAVHEALGEDGLGDGAGVWDDAGEGAHLGLHVRGKAGVAEGGEVETFGVRIGADGDAVLGDFERETAFHHGIGDGFHVLGHDAFERDAVAKHGSGDEEGAGLDAIRDDDVLGSVEFFDAFDGDAVGACAVDFGSHFDEEVGEVFDLGLRGGSFDDGGAFGQDGGHHDIIRSEDGGAVFAHEIHGAAFEAFFGIHMDVSTFDLDLCAEGFEAFEMEVNRAVADNAAAGEGDSAFLQAAGEGAEDANGGPHLPHEVVGGDGFDPLGFDDDDAGGSLDLGSELAEDLKHVVGIREVGDAADGAGVLREEGGGEDGQGAVFRAADVDATFERCAAVDDELFHDGEGFLPRFEVRARECLEGGCETACGGMTNFRIANERANRLALRAVVEGGDDAGGFSVLGLFFEIVALIGLIFAFANGDLDFDAVTFPVGFEHGEGETLLMRGGI